MKLTKHPNYTDRHRFMCPGCKREHSLPLVLTDPSNQGWAWTWNGSFDKPTILPSILVNLGGSNPEVPICHSFVIDGRIQFLSDSTHALSGQTVELPEFPEEGGA